MRSTSVVHTDLSQYLLQICLQGGRACPHHHSFLRSIYIYTGGLGSLAGTHLGLLGLVHEVSDVVVLVLGKCCKEEVQNSLSVAACSLAFLLLLLLLFQLKKDRGLIR